MDILQQTLLLLIGIVFALFGRKSMLLQCILGKSDGFVQYSILQKPQAFRI